MRNGLLALTGLLVLAGCGKSTPTPVAAVKGTVTRFADASARKDYRTICEQLLAQDLVKNVEQYGLPCEQALKQGLGDVQDPKLTVGAIVVRGGRATARVKTSASNQPPSTDTLQLRLAGDEWRIAALG